MDEQRRAELTERLEHANEAISAAQEGEEVDRQQFAKGLADKAWALVDLGEPAEALSNLEPLLHEIEADAETQLLPPQYGAWALVIRATCLWRLNRREEGLAALDAAVARYGDDDRLAVRQRVVRGAWNRLSWRWRPRSDEELLGLARDLYRRCTDPPEEKLDNYAALALGVQADTQKRLGDLRAAIATRRWLLSEYPDVRPSARPYFVYEHWYMLAQDLLVDLQFGEASRVSSELAEALEAADVNDSQMRIADTLNLRTWALRRNGCAREAAEVAQVVQVRFANAEQPQARRSAAWALSGTLGWHLGSGDVTAAIVVAEEVEARFTAERDPATITFLGGELEQIAHWMSDSPGSWAATAIAGIASRAGAERFVIAQSNRPRLTPLAHVLRRLRCAESANALVAERFRDDPDDRRHALYLTTILRRAVLLARHGRFRSSARTYGEFEALGPSAVSAIVDKAEPLSSGGYPVTVWMAAMFGATTDLGAGPEADRTRKAIRRILGVQSLTPNPTAFVQLALRDMDRRARRSGAPTPRWRAALTRARRRLRASL